MCIYSAVKRFFGQAEDDTEATPLIVRSWFPFEENQSNFWLSYFIQYFAMNIGMLIVPCWHSFIVSIMVYVIMKLKILNQHLSEINGSSSRELVTCVNERQMLFDFVMELSSLISSSVFLDFIVFSVLLCALLFQATQVRH
jgi:gustatory receptor